MGAAQAIMVKHNAEVAHRLYDLPGKCENIHGHSLWVEMSIGGQVNSKGILAGLDFGEVKSMFRGHLDATFDHRLLLNENDPWAQDMGLPGNTVPVRLPGLRTFPEDPTTENIAKWVGGWACIAYADRIKTGDVTHIAINVQETHANFGSWTWTA